MNKKNYFSALVAMFAMISVMILSSCSHDDYYYNEEKAEQALNDQYAIAFEKAFGKVGPNVDWGFGSKNSSTRAFTRAVSDYAGYRGNMQPTISFPSDCDASKFTPDLTNVPSYEEYLKSKGTQYWTPEEINDGGVVYINAVQPIKISGGSETQHAKLYIKAGTYDFTGVSFDLNKYTDLYLLEGATVTFDNTVTSTAIFDIYIAEGAELIANGENGLVANSGIHVYNHGTITCSKLEVNSTSFLYNVGTLEAGSVNAESNDSRIVNDGTVDADATVVNAGAVQNNDKWIVSGTTKINSNNSGWVNNGKWTTEYYAYIGGSENVINNCFLFVEEDFEMNISSVQGAFKIDGGGGVLTKNFYGGRDSSTGAISGPFRIEMGQKAVFKVEETAVFESGRSGIEDTYDYGIFGPSSGDEYAVFQAKKIVREESLKNTWGAVTYGGNLYVSAEEHFAQGNDGTASHKFIIEKPGFSIETNIYAAGFKSGKPNITIEETPCCPGFYGDDPNPTYRVIAEDLSASEAGDFDFNDVVFDVEPNEAGNAAKIVVRAAGGIYKLTVAGVEVHQAFGQGAKADGTYSMINTQPWDPEVKATLIESYPGDFRSDEAIRNTIKNIVIKVYKPGFEENGIVLTAEKGVAACKILVDDRFPVVPERHSIANEQGNFTTYVQGNWAAENDDFWWIQQK